MTAPCHRHSPAGLGAQGDAETRSGSGKARDSCHDIVERHRGPDLMIGHPPQQWFNVVQVIANAAEFFRHLAVRIAGPGRQPFPQGLPRSAQQHNVVEPRAGG